MTSKRVGKDKTYEYSINNDCIEYHLTRNKFRENKRDSTPVPTKKLFNKEKTECPMVVKESQKKYHQFQQRNYLRKKKQNVAR